MRRISVLLGLSILLLAGCYSGTRPAHIDSTAPDFTVQDADRKISLRDLRGKIVVLNFWATWCPPCVEEMPSLLRLQAKLKDDPRFVLLAVSTDEGWEPVRKFFGVYSFIVSRPTFHSCNVLIARGL